MKGWTIDGFEPKNNGLNIEYTKIHAQTVNKKGKIMTKSLVISNQSSIIMTVLIIDYHFSSDQPAVVAS